MPDGVQWAVYGWFELPDCPKPGDFIILGCSTREPPVTAGVWFFTVDGPMYFHGRYASLWASHQDRVNGLYVDGHAVSCGDKELLAAANQPINHDPGIKVWQLEDGSDIDYR